MWVQKENRRKKKSEKVKISAGKRPAGASMARSWLQHALLVCTLCLAATAQYTSPPASILAGKNGILNLGLIGPFTFPSANALFYGAGFCIRIPAGFISLFLSLNHASFCPPELSFGQCIYPSFLSSAVTHRDILARLTPSAAALCCLPHHTAGHPGGAGFLQAIDDVNARADLLPNHRIVGWINSTVGMDSAVAATLDLVNRRNIHALIGDFLSDPSQAANYVCKLTSLPQISPNALATVFDSKIVHPTFFRGVASIVSSARSLARLMRRLGYASILKH